MERLERLEGTVSAMEGEFEELRNKQGRQVECNTGCCEKGSLRQK